MENKQDVKTIRVTEKELFMLFNLNNLKKKKIKDEDYIVYDVGNNKTLVLFPSNILQELWEQSFEEVVSAIENKTYTNWLPKVVYEVSYEKMLDKETLRELVDEDFEELKGEVTE